MKRKCALAEIRLWLTCSYLPSTAVGILANAKLLDEVKMFSDRQASNPAHEYSTGPGFSVFFTFVLQTFYAHLSWEKVQEIVKREHEGSSPYMSLFKRDSIPGLVTSIIVLRA